MLNHTRKVVSAKLKADWIACAVAWPNGKPLTIRNLPWLRPSIVPYGTSRPTAPGSTTKVMDGDIVLQLFVPTGTGDGPATQLADQAVALFDGFAAEGLVCMTPREPTIRGDDGRGWYQIDVAIPFRVEVEA